MTDTGCPNLLLECVGGKISKFYGERLELLRTLHMEKLLEPMISETRPKGSLPILYQKLGFDSLVVFVISMPRKEEYKFRKI